MLNRDALSNLGIYVYGLSSAAVGIMDFIWGGFDPAHQPIQAFGDHIPGSQILARQRSGRWGSAGHHLFRVCHILVAPILYGA